MPRTSAQPEPRRDVTCCGQLVIVAAVLAVSSGYSIVRWFRKVTGL